MIIYYQIGNDNGWKPVDMSLLNIHVQKMENYLSPLDLEIESTAGGGVREGEETNKLEQRVE